MRWHIITIFSYTLFKHCFIFSIKIGYMMLLLAKVVSYILIYSFDFCHLQYHYWLFDNLKVLFFSKLVFNYEIVIVHYFRNILYITKHFFNIQSLIISFAILKIYIMIICSYRTSFRKATKQ